MVIKIKQGGDYNPKKPGTSNQTGNNAIQFPWVRNPFGRVAKVSSLLCAYNLGLTDHELEVVHEFPPVKEHYKEFMSILPWFPEYYDDWRTNKANEKEFQGILQSFNKEDAYNRMRYCFESPGNKQTGVQRVYCRSTEHPLHEVQQRKRNGLYKVWMKCSTIIERKLNIREPITKFEAMCWGMLE